MLHQQSRHRWLSKHNYFSQGVFSLRLFVHSLSKSLQCVNSVEHLFPAFYPPINGTRKDHVQQPRGGRNGKGSSNLTKMGVFADVSSLSQSLPLNSRFPTHFRSIGTWKARSTRKLLDSPPYRHFCCAYLALLEAGKQL